MSVELPTQEEQTAPLLVDEQTEASQQGQEGYVVPVHLVTTPVGGDGWPLDL